MEIAAKTPQPATTSAKVYEVVELGPAIVRAVNVENQLEATFPAAHFSWPVVPKERFSVTTTFTKLE